MSILNCARRWMKQSIDDGFTLVEIAVVVAIIGIVAVIAIPTFSTVRSSSTNSNVQHVLEATQRAANWTARDRGDFSHADATSLTSSAFRTVDAGTTAMAEGSASVAVSADASIWVAAAKSPTGTCWMIRETAGVVTYFHFTSGSCTGTAALAIAPSSWGSTW